MSTSTRQTKANQQNAQDSTGPQTDEGKKLVGQNSVNHGPRPTQKTKKIKMLIITKQTQFPPHIKNNKTNPFPPNPLHHKNFERNSYPLPLGEGPGEGSLRAKD